MIYKSKQAVDDIIMIEIILFFDFNFFNDFNKPIAEIRIAIIDKQPIKDEMM